MNGANCLGNLKNVHVCLKKYQRFYDINLPQAQKGVNYILHSVINDFNNMFIYSAYTVTNTDTNSIKLISRKIK